jgi:hypothetical protein
VGGLMIVRPGLGYQQKLSDQKKSENFRPIILVRNVRKII